ncbi:hypothetical protein [Lactiplantibacillus paraplantarum]|uniref:Membrane protein n=1 Tax=Lactiplantibacillus paraplantarum TaxID=60520 RepID=A0AAD0TP72_9LACO|nr:hypothetical protein [Lactiplantibacillus paraplantarum]AVW10337.1 hypothetical protein DA077_07210 [Lactiplantibacillus paraplantarum]AYJ38583.1 hypothetical protein LP667_07035 [Lactiplantibacillus paraplantarum]ERL44068.1 integral membrane protein [Lactiplantibacillus paraplantarum]KRL51664.1 hypothetical protein FD48_GL000367 [Lactiplantibacillus paraplantarum DSM 10667]MCU4683663.1 hypothetical protein [Lactiplantibacillus paraplantarum]
MDLIIVIGSIIAGIGIIINVANTRVKYGWFTHYQSRSRPLNYVSLLLIIIGLIIVISKAYLNGQLN